MKSRGFSYHLAEHESFAVAPGDSYPTASYNADAASAELRFLPTATGNPLSVLIVVRATLPCAAAATRTLLHPECRRHQHRHMQAVSVIERVEPDLLCLLHIFLLAGGRQPACHHHHARVSAPLPTAFADRLGASGFLFALIGRPRGRAVGSTGPLRAVPKENRICKTRQMPLPMAAAKRFSTGHRSTLLNAVVICRSLKRRQPACYNCSCDSFMTRFAKCSKPYRLTASDA